MLVMMSVADTAGKILVAGVDGTPEGWAVVIVESGRSAIRKVAALSHIFDGAEDFDIVAVDVPIGLLDAYKVGGRACDRAARKLLGRPRGSSVFPAPVRPVLTATSWEDACVRSRASAPDGKATPSRHTQFCRRSGKLMNFSRRVPTCARWCVKFTPKCASLSWLACQ